MISAYSTVNLKLNSLVKILFTISGPGQFVLECSVNTTLECSDRLIVEFIVFVVCCRGHNKQI